MAIAFRCTRCRARLHVPTRWAGGSVSCPRCETRVVVPAEPQAERPAFESREVEQSLAMLERQGNGLVAAEDPVAPGAGPAGPVMHPVRVGRAGVTVPWWAIYAAIVLIPATAVVAFACGVWWRTVTGGP